MLVSTEVGSTPRSVRPIKVSQLVLGADCLNRTLWAPDHRLADEKSLPQSSLGQAFDWVRTAVFAGRMSFMVFI
jgi:hypothetical protein